LKEKVKLRVRIFKVSALRLKTTLSSQRDKIIQPGVARNELRRVTVKIIQNPDGVLSNGWRTGFNFFRVNEFVWNAYPA